MALTKQQEAIFLDTLIHMFRSNPLLYDKSEGNYIYTPEKIKLLKELSDYLKNEFNIVKEVKDIVAAWQKLLSQFKNADEKKASGSAASDIQFEYYEDLLFLKPILKHKTNITSTMTSSSINIPQSSQQPQTSTVSTNLWPSGNSTIASASHEFFGQHSYSMPCVIPSVGYHPQWTTPYNFGLPMTMNYPYLPHPSVFPPATPSAPMITQYTPQMLPTTVQNGFPSVLASRNDNVVATMPVSKESVVIEESVAKSLKTKRVPEYDAFAKKKLKRMNDDEQQFQKISNQIMASLDQVNKKLTGSQSNSEFTPTNCGSSSAIMPTPTDVSNSFISTSQSSQTSQSQSADYSNLLRKALSKVPAELQDELMVDILDKLTEFNTMYKIA